jgi:hypothetical protein
MPHHIEDIMKKLALIILVMANSAFANRIAYPVHGTNLPETETNLSEAETYKEEVMSLLGMEPYEKNEITFFTNSKQGLYLIKKNNRYEPAFQNVIAKASHVANWKNGKSFIKALKKYTAANGCIPKLTSVSHGWATTTENGEVHGLSGSRGKNGIYASNATRPKGLAKLGTRTVREHLQEAINEGEVKFCDQCLIQFYACNISTLFADTLAEVSKCQTVVATGKASPYFKSVETELDKKQTYSGFHYWSSAAGIWEERGKGQWYRATPILNGHGEVVDMLKENIGNLYIAL